MRSVWLVAFAVASITAPLAPVPVQAQIPGMSSLVPDKAALLEQGKKLLAELTAMKQDPKVSAEDKGKIDKMIPRATSVNTELAKPNVEPAKLTQLAGQLGDLQKQLGAIKGMGK